MQVAVWRQGIMAKLRLYTDILVSKRKTLI